MISVQNVYYMLAYAYKVLNESGYRKIKTEQFCNVADLCSAILCRGVELQIKRGLGREYIEHSNPLLSVRGKIDIGDTIKTSALLNKQLICTYDDFSVNSYMNRILKTTMQLLLKASIPAGRKKELRKLLVYFNDVEIIDIRTINWKIQYNRNNQSYQMLISICYLVINGLLQTQSDGNTKLMEFFDEQRMCRLYEKFILEYYRKEYSGIIDASASQIMWQLDDDNDEFLPMMQSDIMLSRGKKNMIIDAKYYSHSLQQQYGAFTAHSNNLYQIFTYVKNKEVELVTKEHDSVVGMLLYAQTDEEGAFNNVYKMSGNTICIRTLDLNADFSVIRKQLDDIVNTYLLA